MSPWSGDLDLYIQITFLRQRREGKEDVAAVYVPIRLTYGRPSCQKANVGLAMHTDPLRLTGAQSHLYHTCSRDKVRDDLRPMTGHDQHRSFLQGERQPLTCVPEDSSSNPNAHTNVLCGSKPFSRRASIACL